MLPADLIHQLRDTLADLYTDEESARRISADAGLDDRYIDFSGKAINNWHAILEEAQKQPAQLAGLLNRAQDEYPENPILRAALTAYRAAQAGQAADLEALLTLYLRQIEQATSSLILPELAPQPAVPAAVVQLELAEIYTALDTRHLLETEEATPANRATQRQSVLDFVNIHAYSVILGEPGAGKTIFTNFLTLCLVGAQLRLADPNLNRLGPTWTQGALWPIRTSARSLVPYLDAKKRLFDNPLWTYITATVGLPQGEVTARFAQRLLTDGGIVIIDGLDEIPEQPHRQRLTAAVLNFRTRFPNVRILLTSRVYAYQQTQAQLPDFAVAVLAPFSAAQIATFIQQWYQQRALPISPQLDPQAQADHLQQLLRQHPALHELASRPLLLMLVTVLHTLRSTTLPTSPVQIFEESIAWLLAVWERAKALGDAPTWRQLSLQQIRTVMEALAYTAHARQSTLQGTADIQEAEFVTALLLASPDLDLRPRRVIEYIRDRAGLLNERGQGLYSFPHRAIQEYLAACHLITRDAALTTFVRLAQQEPERWREVVLWAGRKLAATDLAALESLVDQLCPAPVALGEAATPAAGDNPNGLLTLLAGRMLVEARFHLLSPLSLEQQALLLHVRRGLLDLIAAGQLPLTERISAGTALGTLGDSRPGVGIDPAGALPAIEWVDIAPGVFLLGSEPPYTPCTWIEQPYRISRYPITVTQYQAFINADGYAQRRWWTGAGWSWRRRPPQVNAPQAYDPIFQTPSHPQVGVSWYEALAFCRWLSAQLGQTIALPTEFQWERAARHTAGRIYPWGDEFSAQHCNSRATSLGVTSAVGLFPAGDAVCGAADMVGNVWEWCRTAWVSQLSDYTPVADTDLEDAVRRALRGGSFANAPRFVRCANRHRNFPDHRAMNVGFRVVMTTTTA